MSARDPPKQTRPEDYGDANLEIITSGRVLSTPPLLSSAQVDLMTSRAQQQDGAELSCPLRGPPF